jgi:hypothetical protein
MIKSTFRKRVTYKVRRLLHRTRIRTQHPPIILQHETYHDGLQWMVKFKVKYTDDVLRGRLIYKARNGWVLSSKLYPQLYSYGEDKELRVHGEYDWDDGERLRTTADKFLEIVAAVQEYNLTRRPRPPKPTGEIW